jgi:parallel beta-helix repeat protein
LKLNFYQQLLQLALRKALAKVFTHNLSIALKETGKMKKTLPFIFLFSIGFVSKAPAKDIIVSKESDQYNTIQKAVDVAEPGDVIKVRGGIYNETIIINKKNISIEAYDLKNETVRIDGALKIEKKREWEPVSNNIYRTRFKWPWRRLSDMEITSSSAPISKCLSGDFPIPMMQVYENGVLLRGYRNKYDEKYMQGKKTRLYLNRNILAGSYENIEQLNPSLSGGKLPHRGIRRDIRIPGRFLHNKKEENLYVWSAEENNPANNSYDIPITPCLFIIKSPGTVLRNLVISHAATCAVVMENAKDSIIENCFFINNHNAIYARKSDNLTIRKNLFQNKGYWERYWYEDTKLTRLANVQIKLDAKGDFTSMKNCKIYENTMRGGAYLIISYPQNTKIYRNILSHMTNLGISARNIDTQHPAEKYNLQVFENIFHHADQLCVGLNSVNRGPAFFFRNIAYASYCFSKGTGALKKYSGNQAQGTPRVFVYNNTMAFMTRIIGHWYKKHPVKKEEIFKNNIFYMKSQKYLFKKTKKGLFDISLYFKSGYHDNWQYYPFNDGPVLDYNLYWTQEADNHEIFSVRTKKINEKFTKKDFLLMTQKMQIEQHGFQKDPLFLNKKEFDATLTEHLKLDTFSDMDYREIIKHGYEKLFNENFEKIYGKFALSAKSPAIDAGEKLPASWPDLNGTKDAKPDIGAIEFQRNDGFWEGLFRALFGWL